jgi:COP9 signalosome complex subunit 2
MQVKNAIPHPRIMGVIRESGGKMWMMEREFGESYVFAASPEGRMGQQADS